MSDWTPYREPYNKFVLSDYASPGVCWGPSGAAIERNLDERAGYGIDAPFLVYLGRKLATFSTLIVLPDDESWDYWQGTFRALLDEVPARGPVRQSSGAYEPGRAHLIWSPQLYRLGITQCVVLKMPQEVRGPRGLWTVQPEFRQVKPTPKAAYCRPQAPKPGAPLTPKQLEIKSKTDQLASKRQLAAMGGE